MLRGIALIAFVLVCTVLAGRASVCVHIAESDSLRQVAATVPPEDPEVREDAEERTGKDCEPEEERTARERKGFLRRIVRYFEGSNVDRTFEKKIDWSIAPGPNYSSDVGFGIGFLLAGLYRLDRTAAVQAKNGEHVEPDALEPGDILCFYNDGSWIGHVGIYIGDGEYVHAQNEATGVIVSALSDVTCKIEARRILIPGAEL